MRKVAASSAQAPPPGLPEVVREWGRIGCIGFGGPPTHIALLRELCVKRRRLADERGVRGRDRGLQPASRAGLDAACDLLRLAACGERLGALVGGLAFILPGLVAIFGLAALFLSGSPPLWVKGAGAGAGAAVAAVALRAGSACYRRAGRTDSGAGLAGSPTSSREARQRPRSAPGSSSSCSAAAWSSCFCEVAPRFGSGLAHVLAARAPSQAPRRVAWPRSPGSLSRSARSRTAAAS